MTDANQAKSHADTLIRRRVRSTMSGIEPSGGRPATEVMPELSSTSSDLFVGL